MNLDSHDVTTLIHVHLIRSDSTTTDLQAELGFRASDPYALQVDFIGEDSTASWVLAREVLIRGLGAPQDSPAGHGDVSVWRDEDAEYLLIALSGALGTALIAAPAARVDQFLTETRVLVPVGAEGERIDAALEEFVASLLAR